MPSTLYWYFKSLLIFDSFPAITSHSSMVNSFDQMFPLRTSTLKTGFTVRMVYIPASLQRSFAFTRTAIILSVSCPPSWVNMPGVTPAKSITPSVLPAARSGNTIFTAAKARRSSSERSDSRYVLFRCSKCLSAKLRANSTSWIGRKAVYETPALDKASAVSV